MINLKAETITTIAKGYGLLAGTAETAPLNHLRPRLEQRHREGRTTPFEETAIERRLDPKLTWPEVQGLIVIGGSYLLPPAEPIRSSPGPLGRVARCAQGLDYHRQLKLKAEELVATLQKKIGLSLNYRLLIDRNPLVERELALQAGLGISGENCHLINPTGGSYLALGTLLIDRPVEPSPPAGKNGCLHCGRCREACPTGALIAPYIIDPQRCLSYISQAGGIIPEAFRPLMGNRLYGCDRCQEVCPYNREAEAASLPAPSYPFFPAEPRLFPLLTMTKREFSSTIAYSAAGWRGKTTIQRNAVVALGNSKYPEAVPPLARLLARDPRPLIRLHAAWSLGTIGTAGARYYLEKCRHRDPDSSVQEEARVALERMG